MPDFKPTPEQDAVVNFVTSSDRNLSVEARAGAAKTSTLVLMAEAMPEADILCLAFNKAIAEEMNSRMPENVEAKTLHSLGYRAFAEFIGRKCRVDLNGKLYKLLRDEVENLSGGDRDEGFETLAETLDFIKAGKAQGWVPGAKAGHWKPLIDDEEFYFNLPMEPTPVQWELIKRVSIRSFDAALSGLLDGDDMILMPSVCKVSWPRPTVTLVDEAQDLSPINHHMLSKIVKSRRLVAVGDPFQAIYGFRGAYADSMQRLSAAFDTHTLYLTVSFRCASSIVENAHWLAPDMRAPEWAKRGTVSTPESWSFSDLQPGDAIICRNNAPLFRTAIKLIEHGKLPQLAGRDIAKPLTKIMKKLGKPKDPQPIALAALKDWQEKELKRARNGARGGIRDRAECIRAVLETTETLGDAIAYLESLLARGGHIKLMTGHKSKGLEFDRVFFLDQHLCKIDRDQDANIKYVIETRAKSELHYVYTSNCAEMAQEEAV